MKGLNADTSPYSLPPEYWNKGINFRVKDGSLQTVPKSELYSDQPLRVQGINIINPISISQYLPDGATYLNTIVVGLNPVGNLTIYQSSNKSAQSSTPFVVPYSFPEAITATYNQQYGIDNFIFNELSIVNTKTTIPCITTHTTQQPSRTHTK